MKRREFVTLLGGAAAWPLTARAQQPGRTRRIGVLIAFSNDLEFQGLIKAFKQTLEAQGWMDGQNVQFDERWAQGDAKRIPALAAEMMSATPDVILAVATPVLVALRQQTRTIPLVFVNVSDPVDGGLWKPWRGRAATSLASPALNTRLEASGLNFLKKLRLR